MKGFATGVAFAGTAALIWGGQFVVGKSALSRVDAYPLTTIRYALAASTRSHHLKVLRAAGLTRTRVVGTTRFVSLRRDDVDARFPGLLAAVLSAPR